MAVTLNRRAYDHAKEHSAKNDLFTTSGMRGASTGRPHWRKMNSFASIVLQNMANGIWELTTRSPRIPRDTMNFPMGISKMSIGVACSLRRAVRANTST
jgi:hypothetical protein